MSIAPGRKQPIPASVVVVSIADILDQGDLDPVDLVGSVTVDGLPFEPDAWAWRARGATTGIDDPTVDATVFEPPEVGTYTVTLNALVEGVWHAATTPRTFSAGTGAPPIVVVTIANVADQLTLSPVLPTVSATIDRGDGLGPVPATITAWAWKCNGATTLVTGYTTATPTVTPTDAGQHTLSCDVTIGGVVYPSQVEVFRVGDTDGRVQTHAVDWTAAANAGTHTGATVTRDGLDYIFGSGSSSSAVATEGVGLVMDDGAAGSIACDWAGSDSGSGTITQADDVVIYVAYDGGINDVADNITVSWLRSSGADRFAAEVGYYASAHHVGLKLRRSTVDTWTRKATTSASRVVALRIIKGVLAEVRYNTTAYAGTWPVFSTMTKVFATRTSNVVTAQDLNSTDTADKIDPSTSIGRLAVSGANRTIAATAIFTRTIG